MRGHLVHLDLDDVPALDLGPVGDDEAARPFGDYEALDRFVVDGVAGLF